MEENYKKMLRLARKNVVATGLVAITLFVGLVSIFTARIVSQRSTSVGDSSAASTVITLNPTEDAYVDSQNSNTNYGSNFTVNIDGSPIRIGYFKFDLNSLAGLEIDYATLRVRVKDSSNSIQNIKQVTGNWSESTLNYTNRPSLGSTYTNFKGGQSGNWVSLDITQFVVAGRGSVSSFAIDSTGSNGLDLASRESTEKPELIISYKSAGTPTPTISPLAACEVAFNTAVPPCNVNLDIVGLSIDRSSSMNESEADGRTKLAWAKEAASTFVQTLRDSNITNVNISVNSFGSQGNDGTGVLDPIRNSILHIPLSNNYDSVLNAINTVNYIESGTCVECGLRLANQQVSQSSQAKKVAILISDGLANHKWDGTTGGSSTAAINEANNGRNLGVQYHVIGYGLNADQTTLSAIAGNNGSYQYKPNVETWTQALFDIYKGVCSAPQATSTPTPTNAPTATLTPTRLPTATPVPTVTPTSGQATTASLVATEDTYANGNNTNGNYGNSTSLQVDSGPAVVTYMKFDLTSLAGKTINSAKLKLRISNSSSGTQNIKVVGTNSWSENTLTFNNRPSLGSTVGVISSGKSGTYYQIDLTQFINSNKGNVVSLGVDSSSTDGLDFYSSENATVDYRPTLLINQ